MGLRGHSEIDGGALIAESEPLEERVVGTTTHFDNQQTEIISFLSRIVGRSVTRLERIGGGRNSRVYRVDCENSVRYAAKLYYHHPLEDRVRLDAEFHGLQFLWGNGVRCVPRPIAADRNNHCAVYEYIDGEKITVQNVTQRDVDAAVDFLIALKELKERDGSAELPLAKEACFSARGIVENIGLRLARLDSLRNDRACYADLLGFLNEDFSPAFEEISGWCKSALEEAGQSFEAELPLGRRTLSPSDFGFHNALRRDESQIVFVDFEYFGWDDPAKMIADFLIHPAGGLPENLKRGFVSKITGRFEESQLLIGRVKAVYPLFGLKWCLILLNEFIPENLLRRGFIEVTDLDECAVQARQLSEAKKMLQKTMLNYQAFPYDA